VTIVNQLEQAETFVTNDAEAPISTRRVVVETTHELSSGGSVSIAGDTVTVRDPGGRILIRYGEGTAEIAVPEGDLTLSAPKGRVVLQSGLDVCVEAARDVIHHAGRRVDLAAGAAGAGPQVRVEPTATTVKTAKVTVEATQARLVSSRIALIAGHIATTAEEIAQNVGRYELTANRLIERTQCSFRDVKDLAQSRIGRVRTVVNDVYAVYARRSVLVSKEETTIDGSKVLLG
jgi:hypothetical protein